jgi:hypothetical protein
MLAYSRYIGVLDSNFIMSGDSANLETLPTSIDPVKIVPIVDLVRRPSFESASTSSASAGRLNATSTSTDRSRSSGPAVSTSASNPGSSFSAKAPSSPRAQPGAPITRPTATARIHPARRFDQSAYAEITEKSISSWRPAPRREPLTLVTNSLRRTELLIDFSYLIGCSRASTPTGIAVSQRPP